jgi:hypothetical protein
MSMVVRALRDLVKRVDEMKISDDAVIDLVGFYATLRVTVRAR